MIKISSIPPSGGLQEQAQVTEFSLERGENGELCWVYYRFPSGGWHPLTRVDTNDENDAIKIIVEYKKR